MTQKDLFGEPYEDKKTQKQQDAEVQSLFDKWWSHYPRKTAIGKARESFCKAHKAGKFTEHDLDAMVATLKWQTTELWIGRNERYIPHGSTYLHQERWKDERPKRIGEAFGKANDDNDMF